jgi:hypothetical protein
MDIVLFILLRRRECVESTLSLVCGNSVFELFFAFFWIPEEKSDKQYEDHELITQITHNTSPLLWGLKKTQINI